MIRNELSKERETKSTEIYVFKAYVLTFYDDEVIQRKSPIEGETN